MINLLVDIGNSYIKIAISNDNELTEIHQAPIGTDVDQLLEQFIDLYKVDKIFVMHTTTKIYLDQLMSSLNKLDKPIKVIKADDFNNLLDLSNIAKDVVIGVDILLLAYWASKNNIKAIVSLGTVYASLVLDGNKFKSVMLLPSISKAVKGIKDITPITSDLLPTMFDKDIGLNTPDAFASGANLGLEGYLNQILSTYAIDKQELIVTGGDAFKFSCLTKFKQINYLTLIAILRLIKEKQW